MNPHKNEWIGPDPNAELTETLRCIEDAAKRIESLLADTARLDWLLNRMAQRGFPIVTREDVDTAMKENIESQ